MIVGIASDHRGFKLKQKVTKYLTKNNYNIIDYGTVSTSPVDYPDYALIIGKAIKDKKITYGIIICGTGIGASIACNKIKKVRCAKVSNVKEAKLARLHNDANVIALNGNLFFPTAKKIINLFLTEPFSNDERHIRRISKINKIEEDKWWTLNLFYIYFLY